MKAHGSLFWNLNDLEQLSSSAAAFSALIERRGERDLKKLTDPLATEWDFALLVEASRV
jgi:hypothetical protein